MLGVYKFMSSYINNPEAVGSLVPSSSFLGREISSGIRDFNPETVLLEFGAGTGAITKYLPENTVSVEVNEGFVSLLNKKFPDRKIIGGNAMQLLLEVKEPVNIISSIPLINNPFAREFREAISKANSANLIKNLVTYSYGYNSPLSNCGFERGVRLKTVFFNIPPASVWKYW